MKGVEFPIDIVFITEDLDIIDIIPLEPEIGVCKVPPNTKYVLETNAGWCYKNRDIICDLFI